MSDLATLELLTAEVVLVDGAWVAYAEDGTVLDDPDGVLLTGNIGALLEAASEYTPADTNPGAYFTPPARRRPRENDEALWLFGLI